MPMSNAPEISSVLFAYLLGAVPFGLLFGRLFSGVDIRNTGSGNIGATNVLRAAGKKAAFLTLFADILKGLLPVLIVKALFHDDVMTVLAGAAAVLGHNFPVYLGFKGGKGVATSFGVVLGIAPWTGLACLLAWLAAAALWKFSSLSALIAFALYPAVTFLSASFASFPPPRPYRLLSLFIFGMIYYRHRENIKRLLSGAEPKIGRK
jgi:acyl phosphate:glycerol-3-phosphate acyltransferase